MIFNKLLNIIKNDIVVRITTTFVTTIKRSSTSYHLSNGYILIIAIFVVIFGLTNVTDAGTCWIKKMDNGKCKELFSKNMSKEECCKNSQEFAYTINELSDMEYFFAMAIGDGHSCASCLDSCDNAKCSPGKRCVIRKGQPKCICAPICKASAKEKRKHNKQEQNYNNNNNRRNRLFNTNIRTQNHHQQQNKLVNFDNSSPNRELLQKNSLIKIDNIQKQHINNYQNDDDSIDIIGSVTSIESLSSTTFRTFNKNQRKLNTTKKHHQRSSNSTRLIEKLVNINTNNNNNNNNHLNSHHIKDTELLLDNEHQNDDSHYNNNHHSEKFIITANNNDNDGLLLSQQNNRKIFSQNLDNLDNTAAKRKKKNMNINTKNILLIQTSSSLNKNINNHHQQQSKNKHHQHHIKKHHNDHNRHHQQQQNHQLQSNNRQRKINEEQLQLTNTNHIIGINNNNNSTTGSNLLNSRRRQNKDYNQEQQHQSNLQKLNNNNQMLNRNITRQHKEQPLKNNNHYNQDHQQNRRQKQQEQNHKKQLQQQSMSLDEKIRNGFFNHGFPNPEFDQTQEEHQLQIYHGGYANPVCGSDGRTYRTECQLKKRACRRDITTLSVAYRGHCQTSCKSVQCVQNLTCVEDQYGIPHCIPCEINCPKDDDPVNLIDPRKAVCGVDGRTYKSVCDINRQVCLTGRSIAVAYHGICKEESTCNNVHCGSRMTCLTDLVTHKPRCVSCSFKCPRKKRSQLQGDRYVDVKICGNNNHTYHSWCHMRRDSCNTELYIDIKHIGACHKDSFPKNLMDPYAN